MNLIIVYFFRSMDYKCPECGGISNVLKERTSDNAELQREAREVSSQVTVTAKVISNHSLECSA